MKYKVGDRVKIKSRDWYNENKDNNREIRFENGIFTTLKATFLGQIMTIEEITLEKQYILMEDRYKTLWTDEMIEGLVEEEMPLDKAGQITDFEYDGLAYTLPEGYQFVDENGNIINATKIVLEKKKEYPKTYEECCSILNLNTDCSVRGYKAGLLSALQMLLICRDAYWKIAGDEMGLGKPWKPDDKVFGIIRHRGKIQKYNDFVGGSTILEFPTAEMRDEFYENFKEEIEICKELL